MKAIEFDEEVLRQMFNEGTPLEAIAQHFGCSRSPAYRAVRRLGLSRKRLSSYRGVPDPRKIVLNNDKVRELFAEGMSQVKMAARFGCSRTTVLRAVRRLGLVGARFPSCQAREENPNWRGGRTTASDGYVLIKVGPDYPGADKKGYILEHRLVMQSAVGRPLTPDEVVHHINGVTTDNRIENLVIMTRVAHSRHHRRMARLPRASRDESCKPTAESSEAVAC